MTSTAMESSEDFHDVQELQGNNSWSNLMEEEVVKAHHANKEEPQGTTLIVPPGNYVPVPDAIGK